ncbi:MAG: hypothetical protein M3Q39_15040 [Actinomycetota bacterium]|nr:hypothetical protein [Actinomycetota bacterium]
MVDLVGDLGEDVGQGVVPVLREKAAVPVAVRRTRAQGPGERDPVGVQVGGLGDQGAEAVVDQEPGPDLLVDQLR